MKHKYKNNNMANATCSLLRDLNTFLLWLDCLAMKENIEVESGEDMKFKKKKGNKYMEGECTLLISVAI